MPVFAGKRGGVWRVLEVGTGRIATNASGTAVDGKGHESQAKAAAQVRAINSALRRKRREKAA